MRKHADSTVYMTKKKFWSTSTPGTFADFLAADETAGELEESDHITIKRYTPDVLGREDPAAAEFLLMLVIVRPTILVNFLSFPVVNCLFFASWIRIRIKIADSDPDPGCKMNADPDPSPALNCFIQKIGGLAGQISIQKSFIKIRNANGGISVNR